MHEVRRTQEVLKEIRTQDLWIEIARRLGLFDARLEVSIQGGQPLPYVTVTLPLESRPVG